MPRTLRVTCVSKAERPSLHERITHIGGDGWKHTQQDAITFIKLDLYSYYVHRGSHTLEVVVATHLGHEYLKTSGDNLQPDILLSLPECR